MLLLTNLRLHFAKTMAMIINSIARMSFLIILILH